MTQITHIQRVVLPAKDSFKHKLVALFKRPKPDARLHRYRATTPAKAA